MLATGQVKMVEEAGGNWMLWIDHRAAMIEMEARLNVSHSIEDAARRECVRVQGILADMRRQEREVNKAVEKALKAERTRIMEAIKQIGSW